MKSKFSSRKILYPVMLLLLLSSALLISSCRTDEPAVPPLTGPSGARLFITMQANPEDLVIHAPNNQRETSIITVQLRNQQGVGVAGEGIKLRIENADGSIVNIGTLSDFNVTTDRAGFASVTYFAPNTAEQSRAIRIYILAVLTNPAYVNEVTGRHALELEASSIDPGDCIFDEPGAPTPSFTISPDPTINLPVCFNAESSQPGSSPIVNWEWDFGDGSTDSGENVCHTYDGFGQFNVTLLVRDANRNCKFTSQVVDISRGVPATCTILVSAPTPLGIGDDILFTAVVDDPDGSGRVRRFDWNFGDGSTQRTTTNSVTHDYDSAGTFNVLLTITDDQGNISTCTTSVTITGNAPSCSFTITPNAPQNSPALFTFNSTSTDDATDPADLQYSWNFGDGTTGTGISTSHTFAATCTAPCSQNFVVTLTVTDEQALSSTCSSTVSVNNP